MSTVIILKQMCVIAILVAIGVYLYKRNIIDNSVSPRLSAITMDICNPALIMSSVLTGNITAPREKLLVSIGLGVVIYGTLIGLGFLLPHILKVKRDERKFFNMMTVYTNIGFIGIPVARAVLPDNAMLYVIVSNVIFCLLFYTHGIVVLSGGKEKINLKKIVSPGTVMAVLTLLIFWFDLKLPLILENSVVYVGNATTFLSMTLLGVAIARSDIREGIRDLRVYAYIFIRMLCIPLIVAFILTLIKADRDMTLAFVLLMSMPVANLPLIQAEKTGEDTSILSRYIMMTTLVSLVTITVMISIVTAMTA
ncbi:MAG: AEC family transporter [Lachnospiraceae bacterium]|nr:AEC family transporter [Lachnospiraceae bacterium]